MTLLMVGAGKGSWEMRGLQLGAALGARVTSAPSVKDFATADLAILVKRAGALFAPSAKMAGCPIVWDPIDYWQQPGENGRSADMATSDLRSRAAAIGAGLVIGSTQAQADAVGGTYLPHHAWAGLEPADARPEIQVVAYQGNPAYLGPWGQVLTSACLVRGWRFVVNPVDLREADLIVALRGGVFDGWACRQWKSGVKLVNAIAAGKPVITQDTAAFRDIHPPGTAIETIPELEASLDAWRPLSARVAAAEHCATVAQTYTVAAVADRYRTILEQVASCTTM